MRLINWPPVISYNDLFEPQGERVLIPPSLPKDEQARLKELRSLDLLDTASEERFDRLTRIASRLFDVPIALVTLVDEERQWFKSSVGLDAPETSREISFCGHVILDDRVMVVENTDTDERFCDNPLTQGAPHIRFYAGCPLRSLDGCNLGTLCLIDSIPRSFTDSEIELLQDLAALAEREIELTQLAHEDELTNISNRRGFKIQGNECLRHCSRRELPVSVVYIDVNDFKQINDKYGHAEGDRTLSIIADCMRALCRESDVVARVGGDEFAAMLADTTREGAERVLVRFRALLEDMCLDQSLPYDIALSFGIVEFDPERHSNLAELMEEGDQLMYQQKKQAKSANIQ